MASSPCPPLLCSPPESAERQTVLPTCPLNLCSRSGYPRGARRQALDILEELDHPEANQVRNKVRCVDEGLATTTTQTI